METSRDRRFFNVNILIFFLAFATVVIYRAKIDPRARLRQKIRIYPSKFQ